MIALQALKYSDQEEQMFGQALPPDWAVDCQFAGLLTRG
jgi:hypothetical protein